MAISRRQLLLGCCGSVLAAGTPVQALPLATLYGAARRASDGSYSAAIFTAARPGRAGGRTAGARPRHTVCR